jgi:hypothetical protein
MPADEVEAPFASIANELRDREAAFVSAARAHLQTKYPTVAGVRALIPPDVRAELTEEEEQSLIQSLAQSVGSNAGVQASLEAIWRQELEALRRP